MQCSDAMNSTLKGNFHSQEFKFVKVALKTCNETELKGSVRDLAFFGN